jgi:hypothetical protein
MNTYSTTDLRFPEEKSLLAERQRTRSAAERAATRRIFEVDRG